MKVDAVKTRVQGKKGKDTAKGKGKSKDKDKSGGKGKDKRQTPKSKGETSGDDRTCYSCGRRGQIAKDCKMYGVTEVQTFPQHPPGLFAGQTPPSLLQAQNAFAQSSPSTTTLPSEASTMRAVNHNQKQQS